MKFEVHWEYFPEATATPQCCLSACSASMRTLCRNLERGWNLLFPNTFLSIWATRGSKSTSAEAKWTHPGWWDRQLPCAASQQGMRVFLPCGNPEGMEFGLWSPLLGWAWIHPLFHGRTAAGDTRGVLREEGKADFSSRWWNGKFSGEADVRAVAVLCW